MRPVIFLGIGLASVLAACGTDDPNPDDPVDCTKVTGVDTFTVGLEKMGVGGVIDFQLMSADPAPPARGDNTWVIQVNAGSSQGSPLNGASLQAMPFMPAHGHGTPKEVIVTPMPDAGQYKLSPVNMWMPGVWETTIEATQGTSTDTVVYRFCIPE